MKKHWMEKKWVKLLLRAFMIFTSVMLLIDLVTKAVGGIIFGVIFALISGENILLGGLIGGGIGALLSLATFFNEMEESETGGMGSDDDSPLDHTRDAGDRLPPKQPGVGRSVTVRCSPEVAFHYVGKIEKNSSWKASSGGFRVRRLSSGDRGIGDRFSIECAGIGSGGKSVLKITEWVPARRIAYQFQPDFIGLTGGVYHFSRTPEGTNVTHLVFYKRGIANPIQKLTWAGSLASDLFELKKCLERDRRSRS